MLKTKKLIAAALLLTLVFAGPISTASACNAQALHFIFRYVKADLKAGDTLRVQEFLATVRRWTPDEQQLVTDLVLQLSNRPLGNVDGVASPAHVARMLSGWLDLRPERALEYLLALRFFTRGTSASEPFGRLIIGLSDAAPASGSTANMKRVAGGAGSLPEAWEIFSTFLLVTGQAPFPPGFAFAADDILAFGQKVGRTEADVWVRTKTGVRILVDQKHSRRNPLSAVTKENIDNWIADINDMVYDRVLIPTNQEDVFNVEERIRKALIDADKSPDLIKVVPMSEFGW